MEQKQKRTFRRRYLKDYELQVELNDEGREVKVPRYVGNYFDTGLSAADLKALRSRCLGLSLGAAAAAILALFLRHGAMTSFLAILPLSLSFFPLLYGCLGSFRLPRKTGELRSDEVEYGIERVRHSAPGIALLGAAAAVGTLIFHLFLNKTAPNQLIWGDGAFLLCCLGETACGTLLFRCIRRVTLTERPKRTDWAKEA